MRISVLSLFLALSCKGQETSISRTWDSRALSDWATPLVLTGIRPGHFSEQEYYRAPTDNYRTYPVYDPSREPAGYWEALKKKSPEPLVDTTKTGPGFNWAAAGKRVWEELDVPYFRLFDVETIAMARSAKYVRENADKLKLRPDGTMEIYRWVVTPRGIGLSVTACASCHTHYLDNGTAIDGAPLNHITSDALLQRMGDELLRNSYAGDRLQMALYRQFGAPWIRDDIHLKLKTMTDVEIGKVFDAQVPGVVDRVNGSPYYITKVPDLIGMADRMYIDHTATHRHRGAGDLMRYAALVEYSDSMDFGTHRLLSAKQRNIRIRWPDEVLYALSQYVYALQPPPNPNPRDALAEQGSKVFAASGCGTCHTPPLYTNNKLTLAAGYVPPKDHPLNPDIVRISVGTDSNLALKTRKGTGLYKVPSLKGVWYRGLYSHDGSVSSLEDWFNPARLRDDYLPTGFRGVGVTSRRVEGHEFGLSLSTGDKEALIAFLKTL